VNALEGHRKKERKAMGKKWTTFLKRICGLKNKESKKHGGITENEGKTIKEIYNYNKQIGRGMEEKV